MNRTDKSTPVQIRMSLEDLATIAEFVLSTGYRPESAGKCMSAGVESFAKILVSNKLAKRYDLRQAVDYLEALGFFANLRVNKRMFTNYTSSIKIGVLPSDVSPEIIKEALKKMDEIEAEKQKNSCFADLTVPKSDEELLMGLESGAPPLEQAEQSSTRGTTPQE